jgi:hypothetical protein
MGMVGKNITVSTSRSDKLNSPKTQTDVDKGQ